MSVEIRQLTPDTEAAYETMLSRAPTALLYHSLKYRRFLREVLGDSRDRYLVAFRAGELVAALPAFIKSGPFGTVVNSLPFYGSHGSVIAAAGTGMTERRELVGAFDDLCRAEDAVTATIVANPLEDAAGVLDAFGATLTDDRIGQFTPLPDRADPDPAGQLMASFHHKTRNMVRKGEKGPFTFSHDGEEATFRRLQVLHDENITALGGLAKPWRVFDAIRRSFTYDADYRIYTASADGAIVSALLVFYTNAVAEYYTPATHEEYRPDQPLSFLIFLAMQEAVRRGCTTWNWGGTWVSQEGVYRFKSRWNTWDARYRYFIKEYRQTFRDCDSAELLAAYPYFYAIPFAVLRAHV